MQLQATSPESKFPNEYSDVISFTSINIRKSFCKNTKGSRFYESRCIWIHDHLINANGSQKLSCLCLLDLSVTFDTVEHNILISRQWPPFILVLNSRLCLKLGFCLT